MASWKDLYERLIRGCGYSQIIDDLRLKPSRLLAMLASKRMAKALQARHAMAIACQVQGFEEAADSIAARLISLSLTHTQPMAARNACLDVLELSGHLKELTLRAARDPQPAGRARRGTRPLWPSPPPSSTRRRRSPAAEPIANSSGGADPAGQDAAEHDAPCQDAACGLACGSDRATGRVSQKAPKPQAVDGPVGADPAYGLSPRQGRGTSQRVPEPQAAAEAQALDKPQAAAEAQGPDKPQAAVGRGGPAPLDTAKPCPIRAASDRQRPSPPAKPHAAAARQTQVNPVGKFAPRRAITAPNTAQVFNCKELVILRQLCRFVPNRAQSCRFVPNRADACPVVPNHARPGPTATNAADPAPDPPTPHPPIAQEGPVLPVEGGARPEAAMP